MSKVITDFAKLNKAMLTPVERPKESPAAVIEDDGRKHWKLECAGIRITLAKTPSDHCSNSNSAADIARRCF